MGNWFRALPAVEGNPFPEKMPRKKTPRIPSLQYDRAPLNKQTLTDAQIVEILLETDKYPTKVVAERHGINRQVLSKWVDGVNRRRAWTMWQEIKASRQGKKF